MSGLSEADVQSQIEQMIKFIKQEAKEKADEIKVKAEEDFNIMKQEEVEAEKKRIRSDYERKEKQVEVEKKIAYSNAINSNRLKVLKAREVAVTEIIDASRKEIGTLAKGSDYESMLKQLIIQGANTLGETACQVQCRKAGVGAVNKVLKDAAKKSGADISLYEKDHLAKDSCGGVMLYALQGQISCDNTLDTRLDIAYQGMLPQIRIALFGRSESRKYDN